VALDATLEVSMNAFVLLALLATAPSPPPVEAAAKPPSSSPSPASDKRYTMVTRYLGLIVKGPNWTREKSPALTAMMEGHMANINAMAATGKLIAAGPVVDDGTLRGIFVFDTANAEEARALAEKDPSIASGHFALEIHPWMVAREVFAETKSGGTGR
jgi:uncharacterized protein YciI